MSLARLPLPEASSESARIRPSAEASGIVRNARRKLLPWNPESVLVERVHFLFCGCLHSDVLAYCPSPFPFYRPRFPGTDLTRVTSGEVQHVEEEAQLTCQAELLLAKVVLD